MTNLKDAEIAAKIRDGVRHCSVLTECNGCPYRGNSSGLSCITVLLQDLSYMLFKSDDAKTEEGFRELML